MSYISLQKGLFGVKNLYLFKCKECATLLYVEIEDEEDLNSLQENKLELECNCGGDCFLLRD